MTANGHFLRMRVGKRHCATAKTRPQARRCCRRLGAAATAGKRRTLRAPERCSDAPRAIPPQRRRLRRKALVPVGRAAVMRKLGFSFRGSGR